MPKTKVRKGEKPRASSVPLPHRPRVEFGIEGDLWIRFSSGGVPMFVIDDCHLSEFVRRHFAVEHHEDGDQIGRVKILIIPVYE